MANQLGVPKDQVTSWTPYPGGAPANVATGIARLGVANAIFLGALGNDEFGQRFLHLLQERSVHTHHVQILPDYPTRDVLVTRSLDGDRTFAGFGKTTTDNYADAHADASKLPIDLLQTSTDALVTGTLGLAYPGSKEVHLKAVETAQKGGKCVIIIDVNWRPVFWTIPHDQARSIILQYIHHYADIVKVTDEEAEWLWGMSPSDALSHPEKVLGKLSPHAKGVLVSAGEKGSSYAFKSASAEGGGEILSGVCPVMNVKVVDTTGAGDSYLSGFTFYMLMCGGVDALVGAGTGEAGEKLRHAVQFATACGAATCKKAGAIDAQPTLHEVEELLAAANVLVAREQ